MYRYEPEATVPDRLREGWKRVPPSYPFTDAKRATTYTSKGVTYVYIRKTKVAVV